MGCSKVAAFGFDIVITVFFLRSFPMSISEPNGIFFLFPNCELRYREAIR